MDSQQPTLTYSQLLGELWRLCAAKRTGTMFITTIDNHSARFALREGEIVSLGFGLKRGIEAIPLLRKIAGGRFTFSAEILATGETGTLPSTSELLDRLAEGATPLASPPSPPAPAQPDPARLQRVQQLIEPVLAEYIGPMAAIICREYVLGASNLSQPDELRDLIEAIAKEIRDPAKEAQFKQQVLARLGR